MEANVVPSRRPARTHFLIVAGGSCEPVGDNVSRIGSSPSQVVNTFVSGSEASDRLNVAAGVPIGANLYGVGTQDLGEVVIDGRILLQGSKDTFSRTEEFSERHLSDVRERSAPGANNIRDL